MEKQIIEVTGSFVSPEKRSRLVGLCARITGDREAAEDLAQEALLEAWRSEYRLRDPDKRAAWLAGIARNVCLRWMRKHQRDITYLTDLHRHQDDKEAPSFDLEDALADHLDIEVELERKELIALLDRALALLPAETRVALVKHYVEESPLSEIAAQLGTNPSAVAMRLQRGKLTLRRMLTTDMRNEIIPYAIDAPSDEWETTSLWCYICGQHRLLGKRKPHEGRFLLKCPSCSPGPGDLVSSNQLIELKGVKGYKPLHSRLMVWCDRYYREGLNSGSIACARCGHVALARISLSEDMPVWLHSQHGLPGWIWRDYDRFVNILCEACLSSCIISLEGLVLTLPEGRQFLQEHSRIRRLPRQEIEMNGRMALVSRFESVPDSAVFTVISAYDTYEVLHIDGGEQ